MGENDVMISKQSLSFIGSRAEMSEFYFYHPRPCPCIRTHGPSTFYLSCFLGLHVHPFYSISCYIFIFKWCHDNICIHDTHHTMIVSPSAFPLSLCRYCRCLSSCLSEQYRCVCLDWITVSRSVAFAFDLLR